MKNNLLEDNQSDEVATLSNFLERVSLVADSDQIPTDAQHGGVVTLMTLHTAKGLEFPVVFLNWHGRGNLSTSASFRFSR